MILQVAIILGGLALTIYVFSNIFKKKPTPFKVPDPIIFPTPTPEVSEEPTDGHGDMHPLPPPVDCQLATFMPAPQEYYYTDCCGVIQSGIGYEEWEKRAPVSIDANKDFVGMELIGQTTDFNCIEVE